MQIGTLARKVGTTPDAIRFYEREGLLPAPERSTNGYRHYTDADTARLRLLTGLRELDLPLDQAAEIAGLCSAGRCDEVSAELRTLIAEKRRVVERRIAELRFLDERLAHLSGELGAGAPPRDLITGKEDAP